MIDDMTARRFSENVQKAYVRHVRTFAAFLGRSPDTATSDDLRRFQLHLAQQQISAGTINAAIAALRFFLDDGLVLERDRADRRRQGEDDVIIGNRQKLRRALGEPLLRRRALTLRAVTVAA